MGSVAVCCGFNSYEHVPSLSCAMNDAVHPYSELTKNRAFHPDPSLIRIGKVEIDQGRRRCQYEYKTLLRPFLSASHGRFFGASIASSNDDKVTFSLLRQGEVAALRCQLERDLGI